MAQPGANGFGQYHCNYCQSDCTTLRVKCAECQDFDLCVQCFSSGAEMGNHVRDHNYQLIDNGTFPLFIETWSAEEEMLLLDAVEQHGLGNWVDIADHIGTKTLSETKAHYNGVYIDGHVGKATIPEFVCKITDHTSTSTGELSPTLTHPPEILDISLVEQQDLGYMALRDDFDKEHDNDAETLISNIQQSSEDDDLELAMKEAMVDMYIERLKERQHRKTIAREHGLIASKHKITASRRKLTKSDREFRDATRVFGRLQPAEDWERFLNNHSRQRELQCQIKELMQYRKNGVTKLSACREYDELKLRRDKEKENRKKQDTSSQRRTNAIGRKETKVDRKKIERKGPITCPELANSCLGIELLSLREKQLCNSLQIKPMFYITMKGIVLKDHSLRRRGNTVKTRYPSCIGKLQRKRLLLFFKQCGWLKLS
ncbi:transcriptional adapter 2-beta-like [Xenia sp. Carnegie-2017]|uniref:transcriptional adapter 2-beta-like n=1 Tax=Xenia sp. Carnegie-2017 TaxID=2897299 RepID=UPI001F04E2E4|nr:transcriptional adapter 2-beta-like [Xenia sp. Carnegie-2017]